MDKNVAILYCVYIIASAHANTFAEILFARHHPLFCNPYLLWCDAVTSQTWLLHILERVAIPLIAT